MNTFDRYLYRRALALQWLGARYLLAKQQRRRAS